MIANLRRFGSAGKRRQYRHMAMPPVNVLEHQTGDGSFRIFQLET